MFFSFEDNSHRTRQTRYFLSKVDIKDYNVNVVGKNIFNQEVKNFLRLYENTRKIANRHEDDYATGCLLDYL